MLGTMLLIIFSSGIKKKGSQAHKYLIDRQTTL